MSLYLVQHGRSLPKEVDPDQGLSKAGKSDTARIATVAQGYNIRVAAIRHSGKTRARQTAKIMASYLNPTVIPEETAGLKPLDDVALFSRSLSAQDDLMIVGHLPFLERLVSYLITGSADTTVFKFQNAGIVCLDKEPEKESWVIKWALMPEIT